MQQIPGIRLLSTGDWFAVAKPLKLSPRELDVVMAIFDDQGEAAMSKRLKISQHTVHTHVRRAFKKLKVRSRAGVILRIITINGWHD